MKNDRFVTPPPPPSPRKCSMTESLHLPDDSDRYAAEVFDAQRAEILAFFLVGICEDPLDRVRTML